MSAGYAVFLLLAAPVWCAAENRDGTTCRNNADGLLVGCRIRYHRWAKLKSIGRGRGIRAVLARWFEDVPTGAAVLGTAAALISAAASWAQVLISNG